MRRNNLLEANILWICVGLLVTGPILARIPEPDHTFYGLPLRNGELLTEGTVIAKVNGEDSPLAVFHIAGAEAPGGAYVLRLPMDSVDPRTPGTARHGDTVQFFIDGVPAGDATIGGRGEVQQLDLDETRGGLPVISIDDVEAYEGDTGTTDFVFTVSLSEPASEEVTFDYGTVDDTATGGPDYVELPPASPGSIPAGSDSVTITVEVNGETTEESDETFFLELSNASENAVLPPETRGTGTILDDDTPPVASIDSVETIEGDLGTTADAVFTVTLSRALTDPVVVQYHTEDQTATDGVDYLGTSGSNDTVTIPAMAESADITITVVGDDDVDVDEEDETYLVVLTGVTSANATISATGGTGTGTILDDDGFLTFIEAESLGEIEALFGGSCSVTPPDGTHTYVTGRNDDAVAIYDRDPVDGSLTHLTSVFDGQSGFDGLDGAEWIAASPDGAHLYVASTSPANAALAVLERDPITGLLTFLEVHRDGVGLADGLLGASSVALSPDGSSVYVTGFDDDGLAVFSRETWDSEPDYGRLTFVEVHKDGVDGVDGLDGAKAVTVTSDGRTVYVASAVDDAVAIFERDLSTGQLTYVSAVRRNGLNGAAGIAASGDGTHVYVVGQEDDALLAFVRDDTDGSLTFLESHFDDASGVQGLDGANDVVVSHDRRFLYVTGYFDDTLVVFDRNPDTGRLSFRERQKDGLGVVDGLSRVTSISISPDDQHLYATGAFDDAVAVFMRDALVPTDPTPIASTSHDPMVFINDATIDMSWSGAADNPGGSGLDGYSFHFDTQDIALPDRFVDLEHTLDPHTATSVALPDGISHYFHLRTCDRVGNCTNAVHLGPYYIDVTPPLDPSGLAGIVIGDTVQMTWGPGFDALSQVAGYSHAFDLSPANRCDQVLTLNPTDTMTTSASLPDDSWYFHICTRDVAGNWTAGVTAGPFLVETVPPTVLGVGSVASTADFVLTNAEETTAGFTQLFLTFSEHMETTPVASVGSYALVNAGVDGVLATSACGALAGDDSLMVVDQATYNADSKISTLMLNGGVPLPTANYRLFACASLQDLGAGNPLDGDGNGTGGDDFLMDFSVLANNLLVNPNFDADLSPGWTEFPVSPDVIQHSPDDAAMTPTSGSAEVTLDALSDFYAVSQCLAVVDSQAYFLGGKTRIGGSAPVDAPFAYGQVQFYFSTNCGIDPLGTEVFSNFVVGDTAGGWMPVDVGPVPPPAGSRSAKVSFVVAKDTASQFLVGFDDTYFYTAAELLFADGFESGDLNSWSNYP